MPRKNSKTNNQADNRLTDNTFEAAFLRFIGLDSETPEYDVLLNQIQYYFKENKRDFQRLNQPSCQQGYWLDQTSFGSRELLAQSYLYLEDAILHYVREDLLPIIMDLFSGDKNAPIHIRNLLVKLIHENTVNSLDSFKFIIQNYCTIDLNAKLPHPTDPHQLYRLTDMIVGHIHLRLVQDDTIEDNIAYQFLQFTLQTVSTIKMVQSDLEDAKQRQREIPDLDLSRLIRVYEDEIRQHEELKRQREAIELQRVRDKETLEARQRVRTLLKKPDDTDTPLAGIFNCRSTLFGSMNRGLIAEIVSACAIDPQFTIPGNR